VKLVECFKSDKSIRGGGEMGVTWSWREGWNGPRQ